MEDGLQRKQTPKLHSQNLEKRTMLLSPRRHLTLTNLKPGMMSVENSLKRCKAQLLREGKKQTVQGNNGTAFPQTILLKLV